MPIEAQVRVDDAAVLAALERLRLGLPAGGDATPAMEGMGRVLKTAGQLRFREQRGPDGKAWEKSWRARNEGGQTLRLTSRLRNSITYVASRTSVEAGTNVVSAAIHQFGGIIRAKKGPFLAIPITPQARAAGSPRNMQGLAVVQSLKGQFMLVESKTGVVHYLLRRQVRIPARPFMGVSADDSVELIRVMNSHLERAWNRR